MPFDVAITEPGEYYVVFRDRRDSNKSKDLFTWRVGFLSEMDKYEPNDEFTDAKDVDLNDKVQAAVFPKKVYPEETGTLTVKASD